MPFRSAKIHWFKKINVFKYDVFRLYRGSRRKREMSYVEKLGKSVWKDVHAAAEFLPVSYGIHMIDSIVSEYPCQMCKDHFRENIKNLKNYQEIGSREELKCWFYEIHNVVNQKKGKNCPTLDILNQYNHPIYYQLTFEFNTLSYKKRLDELRTRALPYTLSLKSLKPTHKF